MMILTVCMTKLKISYLTSATIFTRERITFIGIDLTAVSLITFCTRAAEGVDFILQNNENIVYMLHVY